MRVEAIHLGAARAAELWTVDSVRAVAGKGLMGDRHFYEAGADPGRALTLVEAEVVTAEGDIIRLSNERGACLAGVTLSDGIRRGVIQLSTGAWYDPADPNEEKPLCVHGNPNVLTRDIGTSALAQGCTGQLTTVQVERFDGNLPEIRAFDPPA